MIDFFPTAEIRWLGTLDFDAARTLSTAACGCSTPWSGAPATAPLSNRSLFSRVCNSARTDLCGGGRQWPSLPRPVIQHSARYRVAFRSHSDIDLCRLITTSGAPLTLRELDTKRYDKKSVKVSRPAALKIRCEGQ